MVSRLDPLSWHPHDVHVSEQPADPGLEAEHLTGGVVEGPGEAGGVACRVDVGGTLVSTALPVSLHGLVGHTSRPVVPVDDRVLLRAPFMSVILM